jgi:hypothetical protein
MKTEQIVTPSSCRLWVHMENDFEPLNKAVTGVVKFRTEGIIGSCNLLIIQIQYCT